MKFKNKIDEIEEIIMHISKCETHLDYALTMCDDIKVFGGIFARECLETLAVMKCILEQEMEKDDE